MYIKAEELIERLYKHENDWLKGEDQNFSEVCADCKLAAEMINSLKISKHTKKRQVQRLRKKNAEKNRKIDNLMLEIEQLKGKI